jgi:uncharacterized protein YkwD
MYASLVLLVGAIAWVSFGAIAGAEAPATPPPPGLPPEVAELVEGLNQERARAGLSPLTENARLTAAATEHARDMARQQQLTHTGSDGSTPLARIARQGYTSRQVAENVAAGQQTPQEAMRTWLDSPPHRQNILGPFSEVGAAHSQGEDVVPYWCVVFGKPPALVPLLH